MFTEGRLARRKQAGALGRGTSRLQGCGGSDFAVGAVEGVGAETGARHTPPRYRGGYEVCLDR